MLLSAPFFMHYFRKTNGFLAVFLLICWVALLSNNILYWHGHCSANGKIIWHAHPYKKSSSDTSFPDHKHTDWQLVLLDASAAFLVAACPFFAFSFLEKLYFKKKFLVFNIRFVFAAHFANPSYRGPPSDFCYQQ